METLTVQAPHARLGVRSRYFTFSWGFTLIELMIVIAILAILVSIAAPSFQRTIAQNAINSGIGTLVSDINFARSEALKRGLSVTLCTSADPYESCATTGDWSGGWIIFLDRNANSARSTVADTAETLLRVQQNLPGDLLISGTNGSTVKSIRFDHSGSANTAGLEVNSNKLDTQAQTETRRAACIATTGRARITAPGTGSCN